MAGKENVPLVDMVSGDLYSPLKSQRKIPKAPFKVLDAPSLQDDFYLNLLDWSSQNVLAVGLGSCVYLWSATTSKVTKLCDLGLHDSVTSVSWAQNGSQLSVGTNTGPVMLWDASKCEMVRNFGGHGGRVGTLAWNGRLLSSGSRDRQILHRDIRSPDDFVARLIGHKQEVCGLKWSFDEQQLSSGGNDNKLVLWNLHSSMPVIKFQQHTAAVKAIAWSPHQHGLLASGGGTADRTIRFWNTLTNEHLHSVDTGSQVCNLMFSKTSKELVSTHGYSQNQIVVWRYPGLSKVATLTGHTYRVLYLSMSPEGHTIVTGAGDETLRFWNAFPSNKTNDEMNIGATLFPSPFDLR
jgi:cell division cycle 20-like protein 1 (cofactor of APC complex)